MLTSSTVGLHGLTHVTGVGLHVDVLRAGANARYQYSQALAGAHMGKVACDHIMSRCVITHHGPKHYPGMLSSCEGIHGGVVRQQGCGDHCRHHTSI